MLQAFETIESYCTVLSHLEFYNDLHYRVWKSFSSETPNIILDSDILHVVFVSTAHVGLPVCSVGQGFRL